MVPNIGYLLFFRAKRTPLLSQFFTSRSTGWNSSVTRACILFVRDTKAINKGIRYKRTSH